VDLLTSQIGRKNKGKNKAGVGRKEREGGSESSFTRFKERD